MEFHDECQCIQECVINDPFTLALTFVRDLCDYEEHYFVVDISSDVKMGKNFAGFYGITSDHAKHDGSAECTATWFHRTFLKQRFLNGTRIQVF
jgi:hypothetical protein